MDEQRKQLDALMGINRNGSNNVKKHFSDDDVCKFYLVGFCPQELFINTKMDQGECKKIHSETLQREYEEERKHKSFGYEEELERELEQIIADVDRKIHAAKKRLERNQEMERMMNPDDTSLVPEIEALIQKSDELGAEGKVEESLKILEEIQQLKNQQIQNQAMKQMAAPTLVLPPALELGPVTQQQQKLRACEVCGALLSVIEADRRLADHFGGRLHIGYVKVREKLAEMKSEKRSSGRGNGRDYGREDSRNSRSGYDREYREDRDYDRRDGDRYRDNRDFRDNRDRGYRSGPYDERDRNPRDRYDRDRRDYRRR